MAVGKPGRSVVSFALAIVASVALLGALVTDYASRALFDSDQFANRATAALSDDAVAAEIARRVTDDLVLRAEGDLIGLRPVIEEAVGAVVGGSAFRSLFRTAVTDVHRAVFEQDQSTFTLTVADIGATVRGVLEALAPKAARRIPGGADAEVLQSDPPDVLVELVQVADDVRHLELILLVLALVAGASAFMLAPDRRLTALRLGLALIACGVLAVVALGVAHSLALDAIDESGPRDAADGIWDAFLGDLRTALLLLAGAGAVIAAGASSLLRPVDIAAPLRVAWERIATVPESRLRRAVRGVLLLLAGVAVVVRHQAMVDLVVIAVGVYVAYVGAAELMRLTIAAPEDRSPKSAIGRRGLAIGGLVTLLIVAAAAVFVGTGGASEDPPRPDRGCNGDQALCERALDEVTLPATHNAMSAATNPGWLFAQQEAGIPQQLSEGIRGLLIDTHYGVETEDGTVKTDLSNLSSSERETYADEIGERALDAALRVRDRIVNSPTVGERSIYLCHRFCELGAIPLERTLTEIRDFLAANPHEVLVIINEDYVSPQDFAATVEASGLIDYVYDGPVGPPWPTLEQMIKDGGRALMLAEKDAGGGSIPWYHDAYDQLTQETPYSFKRPSDLIGAKAIPDSCEPNRGPADASLFLVNHWVDTSPAPRPSNAAKVNARDALLRRVRECERIRELDPNLIAVDFYREGDPFGVAEALNHSP